jgi:hypothetical protein
LALSSAKKRFNFLNASPITITKAEFYISVDGISIGRDTPDCQKYNILSGEKLTAEAPISTLQSGYVIIKAIYEDGHRQSTMHKETVEPIISLERVD